MAQRVVFPEQNSVTLEQFDPSAVGDGMVRMRTDYSLMSTGTEGTVLRGLFDEGTHWDEWIRYPFHPGYSAVGVIQEIGAGVDDLAIGDRAAARVGHASEHVIEAQLCTPIPADVVSAQAVWFGLAKIALMGARAAEYRLGDTVAIIGAGPIGQMSIRWAAAAGAASVVAIDPVAQRLDAARTGGATAVVADTVEDSAARVVESCGGRKPRVVIDTTGQAKVFAEALGLAADHGRVVVLGDTGSPSGQHLTPDVVVRGLSIIGAHDVHSRTGESWDGDRELHSFFFQLVRSDRFNLEGLNTHTFVPRDCRDAYDLATGRRGDTMGILFDWTGP